MTDSLKVLTENTAKFAGGSVIGMRYWDIIMKNQKVNEKPKSGEEIVAEIVSRAGLELV